MDSTTPPNPETSPEAEADASPDPDPATDAALMAQMGFTIFGDSKPNPKSKPKSASHSTSHPKSTSTSTSQETNASQNPSSKRRKHNPGSHGNRYASGANGVPLSMRPPPGMGPTASTVMSAATGLETGDPRYDDDEVEVVDAVEDDGGGGDSDAVGDSRKGPFGGDLPFVQQQQTLQGHGAYFKASFIVEDPWRGMVGVPLR